MSVKLRIRFPYDPSEDDGIVFTEPSLAKQSFAEECDINNIMKRYGATGELSHVSRVPPVYGDYVSEHSFQDSLNIVIKAEEMFADLPSAIRDRFGNDPSQLLAFLGDETNLEEARELGIVAKAPVEPPPQKVEVVNQAAPASSPPEPKAP